MSRESASLWVAVVLAFGVVAGLWYYSTQLKPGTTAPIIAPVETKPAAPATSAPEGPLYPVPDIPSGERPSLRPLPNLDDSDEFLKLELGDLFGPDLRPMLADSRVIERIVATIDNLPRPHVTERMRPLSGIQGPFPADESGAANEFILNPEGYRRFDSLVRLFDSTDSVAMAGLYQRYYSLFQDAYAELGYPDGYFNDRLIDVIDHLQTLPRPAEPIVLLRSHVLYQFADPDLEALSGGQKLLLRMGPDNAQTVLAKLEELRALIASWEQGAG